MKHVIEQWERGDPPNYNTIYRLKSKKFNDDDETANFKRIYLGKKRSKFSSWLKRVLKKKMDGLCGKTQSLRKYQITGLKLIGQIRPELVNS